MKSASLNQAGWDGALIVVRRDLSRGVKVPHIAGTMREAIERWAQVEPLLKSVAAQLELGTVADTFTVDPALLASPFPRAFQFLDGSVYLHHMEKARKARGAEMPLKSKDKTFS